MNPQHLFQQVFQDALAGLVADPVPYVAMIKQTQDAKHGDYQANCAMPLAKILNKKPREVAEDIVKRLGHPDLLAGADIAGPGFINLRLRDEWIAAQVQKLAGDDRLGIDPAHPPRTFVIDFSSPNVAKPMHVGHLRSTIIGDALTRLFRCLGHQVITDNHLGDWGTQFGILLYGYKNHRDDQALREDPVREMTRLYVLVRNLMKAGADDDDEDIANPVAEAARQETAKLHAGDPENYQLWQKIMPWCRQELEPIYRRLDIHFDHTHGESFYQPQLPDVVRDLQERGLAQESEGAIVIKFDPDPPALVRKRDGAFTYTTSDLATIRYRMEQWHPDAILYVVDARQALHFKNLFEAARRWSYDKVKLEHISFGSVLGPDRKPIKTREGGAIELSHLLDEAVERAQTIVDENSPELTAEERTQVAEVVGIGAVKYADLSQNRTSDYVFNWDKMLAMDGNTAAYMQYAYARNRSILRKGNVDEEKLRAHPSQVLITHPAERSLGLQLLRFNEALEAAAEEFKPSAITSYLWDLAKAFSGFNQNCPVLKAETPDLRQSRFLLCDLTARTIQTCLRLLGIKTIERM